jgi:RimJ/RimL family protein N-acetyltransferase
MISTERLDLVPATLESTRSAIEGRGALASSLKAAVPDSWPPDLLDEDALRFMLGRLVEDPSESDWWLYFVILRGRGPADRLVIGTAGYKGRPTSEGLVEIGYGIVHDHRRRGYASEATRGLVAHAFSMRDVTAVIAHTLPDLAPSIGVLGKCGFRFVGDGAEPGSIQFRLDRSGPRKPT